MSLDRLDPGDSPALARDLAEHFHDLFGTPAFGVFAAPGRVNLIGEHVDYNGGLCLPMALQHSTYAALAPRQDGSVTITSRQQPDTWRGDLEALGPGSVTGWPAYVAGVLWALREEGLAVPGMDVVVDSRVPVGAGLSSSAALECSVALGVCELLGLADDDALRSMLVRAAMRAETEVAGAPTGGLDQTISLLGVERHALRLDCRDWSHRAVPWAPESSGFELLVVDTRASHALNDGGYASRRADCERAAHLLGVDYLRDVVDLEAALLALDDDRLRRRVRHVVSEITRVDKVVDQVAAGDYAAVGPVLTASHESLRDDYEVSCVELDAVVETALAQGAVGARMTGGGFGGSAIALVPHGRVAAVEGAIDARFTASGWPTPGVLTSTAGPAAHRVL